MPDLRLNRANKTDSVHTLSQSSTLHIYSVYSIFLSQNTQARLACGSLCPPKSWDWTVLLPETLYFRPHSSTEPTLNTSLALPFPPLTPSAQGTGALYFLKWCLRNGGFLFGYDSIFTVDLPLDITSNYCCRHYCQEY